MSEVSRLRWQCRRGMRELDVLLERYLQERYSHSPPELQAAFRALLELSNPEILDYLLARTDPPPALRALIGELRR